MQQTTHKKSLSDGLLVHFISTVVKNSEKVKDLQDRLDQQKEVIANLEQQQRKHDDEIEKIKNKHSNDIQSLKGILTLQLFIVSALHCKNISHVSIYCKNLIITI